MRWHSPGYGGRRRDPEEVKREGWQEQGLLAVSLEDQRLTWPERELLRQLGERLYGPRGQNRTRQMAETRWTAETVADHFEEAIRTLRKLPPVEVPGYFSAWPQIVRTRQEIAAMEPLPMRVWPSAAAITRLEQTTEWILWIEEGERRLVWSRAARIPWKVICAELGCDRTTAWRRWQLALTKIASRLNAEGAA